MVIVGRKAWGARDSRGMSHNVRSGRFKVHWTVSCSASGLDAEKQALQNIQNFHMNTRGWSDIAYNFVVGPSGRIYEGRGHGVRSAANGNTILNYQHQAIAVIAGPTCDATDEQFEALGEFLRRYSRNDVKGHRDGYSTSCPGDRIYEWLRDESWKRGGLTDKGPSYWTWRAWRCSIGPWEGKGRKEAGAKYRPRIPGPLSPKWPVWFAKLARSGGCK